MVGTLDEYNTQWTFDEVGVFDLLCTVWRGTVDGVERRNHYVARSYLVDDGTCGQESGQDTGQDSGQNTGQDSGQNTGQNSGQDSGQNTGQDSGQNTGQDSGQNSGQEGGFCDISWMTVSPQASQTKPLAFVANLDLTIRLAFGVTYANCTASMRGYTVLVNAVDTSLEERLLVSVDSSRKLVVPKHTLPYGIVKLVVLVSLKPVR